MKDLPYQAIQGVYKLNSGKGGWAVWLSLGIAVGVTGFISNTSHQ